MDTIFGADEQMFERLWMRFESGKVASDHLRNGQLHCEAAFAGAALTENTGQLSHHNDPLAQQVLLGRELFRHEFGSR